MPSSVIERLEYNSLSGELKVIFLSGKSYIYKDVPEGVFLTFRSARSKGRYLNKYIKNNYEFEEITAS